jgi:hypothetical protein
VSLNGFDDDNHVLTHVLDIYIGMELAVVPVFQSEIVPAPIRGMAVGSYQFSLMVSFILTISYNYTNDSVRRFNS